MTPPTTPMAPEQAGVVSPDHTDLPCEDGRVHNFDEHPQSELLTSSLLPRLNELYPDGRFCVGQDSGIYYKLTRPPLDGCRAPDWFFVPGVPALLDGKSRRSYVLWQETVRPLIVIEYASGDGEAERDKTPSTGKFWVYEQAIAASFYAIHEPEKGEGVIELYKLDGDRYRPVPPNAAGRYPVEPLGVDLGLWRATFRKIPLAWLRAWDSATGEMLPTDQERAEKERERAEAAEGLVDDFRREAEQASGRAAKLAERLRELGVDPDAA